MARHHSNEDEAVLESAIFLSALRICRDHHHIYYQGLIAFPTCDIDLFVKRTSITDS